MSDKDKAILRERISLAAQLASLIGPVLVAALAVWLKGEFVTRAEYGEVTRRLDRIELTLARMESQQAQLTDHETRIRSLEARR